MGIPWLLLLFPIIVALTWRHVYAVGQTANDHFVAAVVGGCIGFYGLMFKACGGDLAWAFLAGAVGIWGLFFAIHRVRSAPGWVRWLLAYPSQVAYGFALWGGLTWLVRAPIAALAGRDWLWPGAWLLLPLSLAVLGTVQCYSRGRRLTRHVVAGLPGRLVQLSDIHASALMHEEELGPLVEAVNRLDPALVVVTGDLVMPFSEAEHSYLVEALARIEAPVVCCPGNHDLPVLWQLGEALAERGVKLLVDEAIESGGFHVTGVNFHWKNAREELASALQKCPRGESFAVLLAHDPRLGAWVDDARFDLVLSGHTHGGQVAGNMLGLNASMLRLFGVRDQGWFGKQYVHCGNWYTGLPPRMGVAGEIAVFDPAVNDPG